MATGTGEKQWLSRREAQQLLEISETQFRNLLASGLVTVRSIPGLRSQYGRASLLAVASGFVTEGAAASRP